jgi:hypothetical protein
MSSRLISRLALGGLFSVALGVTAASADVVNFTVNWPTASSYSGNAILFPLFNSNLGTLTGVSVTMSSSVDYTGSTLQNTGLSALNGNIKEDTLITGSGLPTEIANLTNDPAVSYTYGSIAAGATVNFPGSGSAIATDSSSFTATAGQLADFKLAGGGNDTIDLTSSAGATSHLNSNTYLLNAVSSITGEYQVVYTYTPANQPPPIPEPLSMALLGTGVLGIGAAYRRRQRG